MYYLSPLRELMYNYKYMDFNQTINYEPNSGRWFLQFQKAPKGAFAQSGIKITIDPGIPSGERGAFYQTKEPSGLIGTTIEIRCFDNLSGWTSAVALDFATFVEKLIEMMPEDKVKTDTFLLAERDIESVEKIMKGEQING